MKYMVCNCNSYGNIDYGIPLLFGKDDYRTSNDVGLRYMPSLPQPNFFREKDPPIKDNLDLLDVKFEGKKTHYMTEYGPKYKKFEFSFGKPLQMSKTHYMRIVKEQTFKKPPAPRPYPIAEYKAEYCLKQPDPTPDRVQPVDQIAICKVSSLGKGEQPRIKLEETGVIKRTDPYVSTTTMTYVPFTKDQVSGAKKQFINFYTAKESPELQRITIRKPINDEIKFKKVIRDRLFPSTVCRVPYSGKCTEYKSKYLKPTRGCQYIDSLYSGVVYQDSLSKPNKGQTLAAPNMYCTDYCHISAGSNVRTAVHTGNDYRLYKHDYCKNK